MGVSGVSVKSATDLDTLAYYRRMVDRSLRRGDYMYAAEYSWMAYAQAINVVYSDGGIEGIASNDTIKMAQQVNEVVFSANAELGAQLRIGFHAARSLRQHFCEADLPDSEVERSVREVMGAIDLLRTLFC